MSTRIKKPTEKVKVLMEEKKEEESIDTLSSKLQHLIYTTPIDKIKGALVKMNFKGRMQTNKVMLNMQLQQQINTVSKIKELINLLS